jgi:hypothetical protein
MKPNRSKWTTRRRTGQAWWSFLVAALLGSTGAWGATESEAKKSESDAKTESEKKDAEAQPQETESLDDESATTFTNWLDLGLGGLFLDGDKAWFQQRNGTRSGGFGGIEDFHWESQLTKSTSLEVDGRLVIDNHDYALRYELVRPDLGFFRGGFKQYRTYYDGSGGFFPPNGAWLSLQDDALELDRGEVWVEGGLTLPKKPQITFKYTYQYRVGYKNSTSWGDSNLTSPGPSPSTPVELRGFAPSFWDINEKRHIFQGDIKHKVGKTDLGVGLRYEISEVDDALKGRRRPGEGPELDRHLTSRQEVDSDIFNARVFSETRLNDKVRFSTGYSFTTLDTDFSGSRVYSDGYDVSDRMDLAYAQGFLGLNGGSQMDQHIFHLNLMATPWTNLTVVPSLRVENLNVDSVSAYLLTGSGDSRPLEAASERSLLEIAERLELRYTGLTNWVLYARGDWAQAEGDLSEKGGNGPILSYPGIERITDDSHFTQKYTAGANWYPLRRLNLDLQYYFKRRENEYDHHRDSTLDNSPDAYPAFLHLQDFETDDVNCRLTFRPLNNLTLVSRYDFQYSRTHTVPDQNSGISDNLNAKISSHLFGQSITWVPWSRLYLQASVNYARDETDTPADRSSAAAPDGLNDYWTASLTSGFVLDNKTDLQLHYFFFHANNFIDNSAFSQPYGTDAEEHGLTVTLARKLTKQLRLTLKYGYFQYRDSATGGHNDYDAHLVYTGLHYRF